MARETGLFGRADGLDWVGILIVLAPTHTPPPLSRPAGRKRGASCGRVLNGGKFEPDFTLASKWQQLISKLISGLEASAPWRGYFPPSKTRPNVAVSSLSAPAGVERVGVRGGIQRIKNNNAVNSQPSQSARASPRAQKIHLKTEHITHTGRGLEAKNVNIIAVSPPAGSPSPSRRSSP